MVGAPYRRRQDANALHAGGERVEGGAHLGHHAAADGAVADERFGGRGRQEPQALAGRVEHAGHVAEQDQLVDA
jgi:hypothetical protein